MPQGHLKDIARPHKIVLAGRTLVTTGSSARIQLPLALQIPNLQSNRDTLTVRFTVAAVHSSRDKASGDGRNLSYKLSGHGIAPLMLLCLFQAKMRTLHA